MTDRAGRWATVQVAMLGRSVAEVARELGCDGHTVADTVVSYGTALVDDPARIADTTALGLDETPFVRRGEWHRAEFVDVDSRCQPRPGSATTRRGRRPQSRSCYSVDQRPSQRLAGGDRLGMPGPVRPLPQSFRRRPPQHSPSSRPFPRHKKSRTAKLDECRRRVQNDTLGHREPKTDPAYRARRLLTKAHERHRRQG